MWIESEINSGMIHACTDTEFQVFPFALSLACLSFMWSLSTREFWVFLQSNSLISSTDLLSSSRKLLLCVCLSIVSGILRFQIIDMPSVSIISDVSQLTDLSYCFIKIVQDSCHQITNVPLLKLTGTIHHNGYIIQPYTLPVDYYTSTHAFSVLGLFMRTYSKILVDPCV